MRDFSIDTSALALNTATLGHNIDNQGAGWTPEQVIDLCADHAYGAIVFWTREFGSTSQAQQIGQYAKNAGLALPGMCRSPFLIGPLAPGDRQVVLDALKNTIELCAALQADSLTVCVGGIADQHSDMQSSLLQVKDILSDTVHFAQQCKVRLALEPMHPVYAGNRSCLVTVRDSIDLILELNDPVFGLAIDVYHVWWDLTLAQELKRLSPEQILSFHLCDWLAETQDVLLDRGMMGDGVADLKAIRRAVEGAGYNGYCEVEIFSANNWWQKPPDEVIKECLFRFKTVC